MWHLIFVTRGSHLQATQELHIKYEIHESDNTCDLMKRHNQKQFL